MKSVSEFIKSASNLRSCQCKTCLLKETKKITLEALEFNEARRKKETAIPWGAFIRLYLKPKYNYPLQRAALKTHIEKCLGKEVF